jgi:carbon monoxide dehydrogenase subunit G
VTTFVERSIEVAVPVRTAYDQWTQFEEFPRFMAGVREVKQIGDALTHWVADIGGIQREWDATILEQVPDEKVAWAATTGATNAGAVYFTAVGDGRTQVRLTLEFEPEGIVERVGDVFDIVDRQAVADLDRFKAYIEAAGSATGGWRGTVDEGEVQRGGTETTGAAAEAVAGAAAAAGVGAAGSGGSGSAPDDVSGDLVAVGPTGGTRGTVETEPGPARVEAADDEDEGVGHSGDPVAVDPEAVDPARSPGSRVPGSSGTTSSGEVWTDEPGARAGTTEAVTDPVGEDWSGDADTGGAATGTTEERGGLRQDDADRSATDMGGAIPSRTEPDGPRQPNA